jgi:hypothetical protein
MIRNKRFMEELKIKFGLLDRKMTRENHTSFVESKASNLRRLSSYGSTLKCSSILMENRKVSNETRKVLFSS